MLCKYWQHIIGQEADAGFDAGEFSSAYHEDALAGLEACGECPACIEGEEEDSE